MHVLVACEFSGAVRDAFRALGHQAYSCDIIPSEDGNRRLHLQCDVRESNGLIFKRMNTPRHDDARI